LEKSAAEPFERAKPKEKRKGRENGNASSRKGKGKPSVVSSRVKKKRRKPKGPFKKEREGFSLFAIGDYLDGKKKKRERKEE